MSLNALLQSANALKGGVQTAVAAPGAMKPGSPSGQGLKALMDQMKALQPKSQPQPIRRPNINRGVRQVFDRPRRSPQGLHAKTPSMSPEMRQMMMGGKGAPV